MQPPLFILSPPRSFTTITCAMLGNHPQMFGLAETNLFAAATVEGLLRFARLRPNAEHGLLRSITELMFGEQSAENVEATRGWLRDNEDMATSDLFRALGDQADGRSLIEKSPLHVYSMAALERMRDGFPDAFYLHLTRHPVPVLASTIKLRERVKGMKGFGRVRQFGQGDLDMTTIWLKPHLTILEFLESVPAERQMRLRGEDLLTEPRLYLPQICAWMGKKSSPAALDAMMRPEASPFARYGPPNAPLGNDPGFMESPELRPFRYDPIDLDAVSVAGDDEATEVLRHYAMLFGY